MLIHRRAFLRSAAAMAMGGAAISTLGAGLPRFQASAADTSGYKAMVCLFLLGGVDTHDMLIPYDQQSYDTYADIRSELMGQYASTQGGNSRLRDRLLPLAPDNAADFGGRQFALPPEMQGIHSLFQNGRAAIVSNVGPLIRPVTKAEFENDSPDLPQQLFSHNDQQSTWMSSQPEGAQFGWGGRFADAVLASSGQTPDFTSITTLGNDLFLTGDTTGPFQVGLGGPRDLDVLSFTRGNPFNQEGNTTYEALRDHFQAEGFSSDNLIARDMAGALADSLQKNEAFAAAYTNSPQINTSFPDSFIAAQLRAVAQTIATRGSLLMDRQIFFVASGGFDTHSAQAVDLPRLLGEIDAAVVAFVAAMEELGLSQDVTLFTATDFGRTLAINGDGTDHGWGSHQMVIGGGARGGRIYGNVPPATLDHDWDAGGGRLIPTLSVEQYAAGLGNWFGLTGSELGAALPNLGNFSDTSAMGFI